jgi:hypothetical protein
MNDEKRLCERVLFVMEARWEGLSGKHVSRVYDISLTGCYIESLGQVQLSERIEFEIQSPTGRWLPLQGKVMHSQLNMGFGVSFINMSEIQQEALAELIDYARSLHG